MKVDMSPEGVSGRLRAMGELWQLSVELMTSKLADGVSPRSKKSRAIGIQDSIREVLMRNWDPIGVSEVPEALDEYDAYISPVYRILVGTRSTDDLVECLRRIEREEIGIRPSDPEAYRKIAEKLLDLEVTLN
jgi:hypothetical protein